MNTQAPVVAVIGICVAWFGFIVSILAAWIYGLVLAFSAHVLVGLGSFIFPVLFTVYGVAGFFGYNLPEELVEFVQSVNN